MQKLREFFASSSGLAPARQGLALGWVISVLTGITVLLGAKEGEAYCFEEEWTDNLGYSAGCDRATNGDAAQECRDCQLDIHCVESCEPSYCCA